MKEPDVSMIAIDRARCTGCGWCSDECPARIFRIEKMEGDGRIAVAEFSDSCNRCGHCAAICPEGAITHQGLSGDFAPLTVPVIPADLMGDFLMSRRSVRAFKGEPVPRALTEQLLNVATHAGTATNAQTEGFVVIQDANRLRQLEDLVLRVLWKKMKPLGNPVGRKLAAMKYGRDTVSSGVRYYERFKAMRDKGELGGSIFRKAPMVIAVEGLRTNQSVHENAAVAARNMEILAMALGLGTCWAGFLPVAAQATGQIARFLDLPSDRNVYSALMVGYPKHRYAKTIHRPERTVRWL